MLGTVNIPYSKIEEDIENICVEYGHGGYDVMTCDEIAVDKIIEYFQSKPASQQWNLSCSEWPNEKGALASSLGLKKVVYAVMDLTI